MPTVTLTALEAQVVALAAQKKNDVQAQAQRVFDGANVAFAQDVKLVTDAHPEIPKDAAVNFHVEHGVGTVSWPDIAPKACCGPGEACTSPTCTGTPLSTEASA